MTPQDDLVFEQAKAHFIQSIAYIEAGKWAQAEIELRLSLRLVPDRVSGLTNLSTVLLKLEKYPEAEALIAKVIAMDADNPEARLNEGIIFNEKKEYDKALASYAWALKLKPDYAEAWANRGSTLSSLGQHAAALQQYEQAFQLNNRLSSGVRGLLDCHWHLKNYQRLFEIKTEHQKFVDQDYLSNELLGYVYLELGDKENAFNAFAKARVISEKIPQESNRTEWPILLSRLKHDYAQLSYLEERGVNGASGKAAISVLKNYVAHAPLPSSQTDDDQLLTAIRGYHHVPDMPFSGKALGPNNYPEIETAFLNGAIRLVVIDNFLSDEALSNLRRYCVEATVWKRSYPDGYIGSFMGTGFCSRVILAIADELKSAMPNVIGSNALSNAWGFKYDQSMKGINLHADFAKINTNFWITPDAACLDSTKGGLLIYDVPAPNDWGFYAYNCDQNKIQAYLKEKNAQFVRVPYRSNRCVLFDSTYFHATDDLSFAEGYANRRINCTLLYGRAL